MPVGRLLAALGVGALLLGPVGYLWSHSRMPSTYSMADMGYLDYGDGSVPPSGGPTTSVADLRTPPGPADVSVDLDVQEQDLDLGGGAAAQITINGDSPGPTITTHEGDLLEVRVANTSVAAGLTLHWHGVELPNGEDGVAGVTQDAIAVGDSFTYRFVTGHAGTFWYHSHQVGHSEVVRGLLGALVVLPSDGVAEDHDTVAVRHSYRGRPTLNGSTGDLMVAASSGESARVRVVNTDNGTVAVWVDSPFVLAASDGYDVNEPARVTVAKVMVAAAGRADLVVTAPARVYVGTMTVVVGEPRVSGRAEPADEVDLLTYGAPAPLPFDPTSADRSFDYDIGRRPGFVRGRPGFWWTINGHTWPDLPMFVVEEGEVVVFRVRNTSGMVHPMHVHGHHFVVVSRDGERATGSPWWADTVDVRDGETVEIALLADNPGLWMYHCHNLQHARDGLIAHLVYAGVDTPFEIGGEHANEPT